MNKTKLHISALVGGAMLLSACGDFLEPNSTSEFVPEDINSLNEILLGEAYPRNDKGAMNFFLGMLDDDISAAPYQTPESGFDANVYLASYSWQPDMYEMMEEAGITANDMYETYYKRLKGANAVLDYIHTVSGSEDDVNNVKAQAYALRGFFYLQLVNIFGQPYSSNPDALGVPLKINSGVEETPLSRNTVRECYAQIVADLEEAVRLYNLLPSDRQWKANYRTSLPMAQLILSRTYLYMENWEKAAQYAKAVMDNKKFSLLDLNTVETESTEYGRTTRVYTNYHSYENSSEVIWPYGQVSDWAGWENSYSDTDSQGNSHHCLFRASDSLLNTFDDKDLRKERYIVRRELPNNKTWDGESNLMPLPLGKMNVNNYFRPNGTGTGIFGRSIRLSEAYLNYMEAEAMLYKTQGSENARQEALNALNKLRQNRFAAEDFVAEDIYTADDLIAFIHNERRRELCFESHRWYDLRRWGMPEIQHVWYVDATTIDTYTLKENDPLYTVPIPDVALEKNINLVQNELGSKRVAVETTN